jgi:peptidyl-dipeptidase Dcp
MELLENVWGRAKDAANRERQALEDFVASLPLTGDKAEAERADIQPWDWRYYAEKVRV